MIIETDIGRDADDLFALLWLYSRKIKIDAITITPGDPDQIAVAKCLNKIFGTNTLIGITDLSRNKSSSNPFHQKFIARHGGRLTERADGIGYEIISSIPIINNVIVLGPCTNIGQFLLNSTIKINRMSMQGGFLPCDEPKFAGMADAPTFNLNGDRLNGLNFLNYPYVNDRLMIGKNVGHFKCIWTKDRIFKNELMNDTFKLFSEFSDSKKLQDPMAVICHFYPHIGTWVRGKTIKSKSGWTTDLTNPVDYILSDIDEEKFWDVYSNPNVR